MGSHQSKALSSDRPLISIVLPCYNSGQYLDKALLSVDEQTYPNTEVIVVDDGSDDPKTLAVLGNLPAHIRLIRQENRGLPGARNAGFQAALGEFVLPLDCDDWLAPTFLESAFDTLSTSSEASYSYCLISLEGERSGTLNKGYNFFEQLFFNQMPYCLLIPKAVWVEAGGYDETMRRGYEDWEFNIRLGKLGYFGVVHAQPLFHYRVSKDGMLQSTSSRLHCDLWTDIQARNPQLYGINSLLSIWWANRRKPTTYPKFLLFGWWCLNRILPPSICNRLFARLLNYSQSNRAG